MKTYIATRIGHQLVTLVAVLIIVFIATHAIGDPVRLMMPDAPPDAVEAVRAQLGLNAPLYVQFGDYAAGLLHLDFGKSIRSGQPTLQTIASRLPATFLLATAGTLLAAALGLLLGGLAALRPRSILDKLILLLTTFAMTSLDFWVALMLIYTVSVGLGWLPTSGYGELRHLILPMIVVALRPIGRIAEVTRPAIMNELAKPYVVALRARGLSELSIAALHAGRNAAIVLITLIGYEFAHMVNGSAIIETVFAWPGVGFLLINAVYARDWPLITSITVIVATIVIVLNLIIDLVYAWVDPRVQYR